VKYVFGVLLYSIMYETDYIANRDVSYRPQQVIIEEAVSVSVAVTVAVVAAETKTESTATTKVIVAITAKRATRSGSDTSDKPNATITNPGENACETASG
jgi:hypothetical protein